MAIEKINILVGGPTDQWPDQLKTAAVAGPWIAVDKGAIRLLKLGIIPEIAVGDFDSTTDAEMKQVTQKVAHIEQYQPEKDETDTQIGVKLAINHFQAEQIDIYGATGGRIDHLLANLFLPTEARFQPYANRIRFIDNQNTISFFQPGHYEIEKEPDKRYLAFVTLTPVNGLTLTDEKYQLDHYDSVTPMSWASNEFKGTHNHFSFDSGIVAVIQSKD